MHLALLLIIVGDHDIMRTLQLTEAPKPACSECSIRVTDRDETSMKSKAKKAEHDQQATYYRIDKPSEGLKITTSLNLVQS